MQTFTPFGIRHQGDLVTYKLKFHPVKFKSSQLCNYGSYRTTNKGYIIFEATVKRCSPEYSQIEYCLDYISTWPKLAKPNPAE